VTAEQSFVSEDPVVEEIAPSANSMQENNQSLS